MSQLTVSIPPILQTMLFLRALHPRYKVIIDMFPSKQKDISVATINSILSVAKFMVSFLSLALMANLVSSPMIHLTLCILLTFLRLNQ